jgi:hypothetical protein
VSSTGKDFGEILSRLNASWGVKEVANIMSMINKRTTPIDEDEGLIRHVIYAPLVHLRTNANAEFNPSAMLFDHTVDFDHYSGWGMRKIIPDNVRAYDLTHDNSNATGRQGITRIDFEDRVTDQIGSNR